MAFRPITIHMFCHARTMASNNVKINYARKGKICWAFYDLQVVKKRQAGALASGHCMYGGRRLTIQPRGVFWNFAQCPPVDGSGTFAQERLMSSSSLLCKCQAFACEITGLPRQSVEEATRCYTLFSFFSLRRWVCMTTYFSSREN